MPSVILSCKCQTIMSQDRQSFLQTVYYDWMQNDSSSFQLWTVNFDLFSHSAGSSLQPKSTSCVSRYWPNTGEMLFCSCYHACHTDAPRSSPASHSVVWRNVDSNHHTHFFFFAFPLEGMVCMCGWRLKGKEGEDPCVMFYWNVQRAVPGRLKICPTWNRRGEQVGQFIVV